MDLSKPASPRPIELVMELSRKEGWEVEQYYHHGAFVRSPDWHASWWWDMVPDRLRVRLIGNADQAKRDMEILVRDLDDPAVDDILSAVKEEIERIDSIPWGAMPIPKKVRQRREKKTDSVTETKDRLTFGDLPLGWRKTTRRKKT